MEKRTGGKETELDVYPALYFSMTTLVPFIIDIIADTAIENPQLLYDSFYENAFGTTVNIFSVISE